VWKAKNEGWAGDPLPLAVNDSRLTDKEYIFDCYIGTTLVSVRGFSRIGVAKLRGTPSCRQEALFENDRHDSDGGTLAPWQGMAA
jgi:hypothetical protein